uniref:SDR family NAD(P)-dependent oxidoreductase n=1 Tax=Yeosuana marina TaxID=1565536 RepID=UPI0030C85703
MTKFSLKNKVALVTGGGSGIGKAISKTFAEQGAKVHILDFNLEGANQTVSEIESLGNIAKAHQCDVSNQQNVNEIIKKISESENVDILVNNAGIAHVGNIEAVEEADLDRLYNVNIKGVFNCSKACIPYMKNNGSGIILNLASIASSVG